MATHSSILAWRIPGTEEPGGLLSMGSHRVGHDLSDSAAAAAAVQFSAIVRICSLMMFKFQLCIFPPEIILMFLPALSSQPVGPLPSFSSEMRAPFTRLSVY